MQFKMKTKGSMEKQEGGIAIFFLAPFMIGYLIFELIPIISTVVMSFINLNSLRGITDFASIKFVGFENYINIFKDSDAIMAYGRSMLYTLYYVPLLNIIAIVLALLITRQLYLRTAIRTMIFMPYVANIVAVAILFGTLLNPFGGPINELLKSLGINNPPMWLFGKNTSLPTIAGISIWKDLAFQMVVYMAAINNVSKELYESADVEGASIFTKITKITIPMISPTIFAMVITSIINSFQNYAIVKTMTDGGPGNASRVAVLNIYQQAFEYNKFSYASAQAMLLFLIILVVTLIQWKGQKRWVHY
ncbi:carbohydrate ABC transporter permease [Clostridium estertheticum]|uniref:Sugar ABC transporter permease n=2 Tax=Clostridium estertheticum TaxID=238834 RepID=A0AA47EMM9_9CLOT|nr:sugar ABC transporter permease [Clostridium estertheticum]MBU3157156.1 sugar ABC transporter permease [Clostridium estertheticum]WAG62666.1 sugar ABC transporter permease [Clostridium estertheticum]